MARLDVRALVYPPKHKYSKIFESLKKWYHGTAVGESLWTPKVGSFGEDGF